MRKRPRSNLRSSLKGNAKTHIELWLDDENATKRSSRKARLASQHRTAAHWTSKENTNAVVSEVFRNQCRVRLNSSDAELLCNYRKNQIFFERHPGWRERSPVAVGDRVLIEQVGARDGIVVGISQRDNFIARPAPGREEGFVHILLCNIDLLAIVASAEEPVFSPGLVDRFLVTCKIGNVSPLILVNKIDLNRTHSAPWEIYQRLGYPVKTISAKTLEGVDDLKTLIQGKTIGLAGHSGVGKTSLLRCLLEGTHADLAGKIGEVNALTGKGKHTTTAAHLYRLGDHTRLIDTPGVRSVGLVGVRTSDLRNYFSEFEALPCQTPGCSHINEEGCQARDLVRYDSYRRIYEALAIEES